VLLIHGFASTAHVNWVFPGWVKTLDQAGYRVIALDNRGHGESDKPHDPEAYHPETMAADAAGLLDSLNIGSAHVMGYSMGARISAFLTLPGLTWFARWCLAGLEWAWSTGSGTGIRLPMRCWRRSLDDVTRRARPNVPCLRRADQERPTGAGCLHPHLADAGEPRRIWPADRAGAGRRGHAVTTSPDRPKAWRN
jgi:pimeloyl-ACP methyl ester carboxylesterase